MYMRSALKKRASAERRERARSLICDCNLISANWLIGALDMDDTAFHADIPARGKSAEEGACGKKRTRWVLTTHTRVLQPSRGAFQGRHSCSSSTTRVHSILISCLSSLFLFLLPLFFRSFVFISVTSSSSLAWCF